MEFDKEYLKRFFPEKILQINFMDAPQPFFFNKSQVKAFVLGADPTNFSQDKKRVELYFAFGIGQNSNYFRVILQNLNEVGLHLEDLYIQNLLPYYQDMETGENKNFKNEASENAKTIAKNLDKIDPSKRIPVFITAELVYKAVLNEDEIGFKAEELYSLETETPIPPNRNKLKRPIIPLFRHHKYRYANWPKFKEHVLHSLIDK